MASSTAQHATNLLTYNCRGHFTLDGVTFSLTVDSNQKNELSKALHRAGYTVCITGSAFTLKTAKSKVIGCDLGHFAYGDEKEGKTTFEIGIQWSDGEDSNVI